MKAAYTLQGFATSYYVLFTVLTYIWLGDQVKSPSFSSLATRWQKAAYGIALLNFLVAGALYTHTASKLYFVRLFRASRHLHENTVPGWAIWTMLIVVCNGLAFVLAVGVPIFTYVVSLGASLFASWFTYGIAGFFFLYDAYQKGRLEEWKRRWIHSSLSVFTIIAGLFMCVAGLYVSIKGIIDAYNTGQVSTPFSC